MKRYLQLLLDPYSTFAIFIAALLLSGCATPPENLAKQSKIEQTRPTCNGATDCNAKWEAAQLWVVHNAGLKIQLNTNVIIETYNSTDMSLAVRVTKEPLGGGRYKLVATVWCDNDFGCHSDPLDATLNFNSTIGNAPEIIGDVAASAKSQKVNNPEQTDNGKPQQVESFTSFLKMAPSLSSERNVIWLKSVEPPINSQFPSASVMGIACKDKRDLSVVVGTEIVMKKTFSIYPPLTDVRYYFDSDDYHRNWQQFGPSEAGPFGMVSGFVGNMIKAKTLKVAFEEVGKDNRAEFTFKLDDPELHGRIVSLAQSCK